MVRVLLGNDAANMLTSAELKKRIAEKELLAKPSLKGLVYLLRHPQLWPEGFRWDWSRSESCAMGLAAKYWGGKVERHPYTYYMEEHFGLTCDTVLEVFCSRTVKRWFNIFTRPTPSDIARYIEKRLLKGDKTSGNTAVPR